MRTLVLNGGSSSIKYSVFSSIGDVRPGTAPIVEHEGQLSGIGTGAASLKTSNNADTNNAETNAKATSVEAKTLPSAVDLILNAMSKSPGLSIDAVGYRVVHPGAKLHDHQRITPQVLHLLDQAKEFAPLHDPEAVMLIRATMPRYPGASHYACFDTVFHRTMPEEARTYPLPDSYRKSGVHRYGFHGLSCESVVRQLVSMGALPQRMVIAHLGSGCSITALMDGRSVDTTMGLTPTGGVLMGTRSGDLDPGLMLYLLRSQQGTREQATDAVETLLNHGSGVSVLSDLPNDMKAVRSAAAGGSEPARLALKVFTRSITKAIGGFCWLLGGLDAIVFTGGIGEHDAQTRSDVLAGLSELGVALAKDHSPDDFHKPQRISSPLSRTQVFVVPAQEDLVIALHVQRMMHTANSQESNSTAGRIV